MEVTNKRFEATLISMLQKLAGCHFVSFDLELSGVPQPTLGSSLQSLQERYSDIKYAAEKYSIVQMGFTIAHEDELSEKYHLYPYNMYLSPLVGQRLEVARCLSFQSYACSFILAHGFNMQTMFREGVPYLSRPDAVKAKARAFERYSWKNDMPGIALGVDDTALLAFVEQSREKIREWGRWTEHTEELLIAHDAFLASRAAGTELSRVEKSLVHQLVRTEFPNLTAVSQVGGVVITEFDKVKDEISKKQLEASIDERIQKQIGIRWFVEGLCGGYLETANPVQFAREQAEEPTLIDVDKVTSEFQDLCACIRQTRPVLVGHNLFVDLVFLVHAFLGYLPEQVEDFRFLVHKTFPCIIDTKYLATHGNFRRSRSSLSEVDREYADQSVPVIEAGGPQFTKYENNPRAHEAGYDSHAAARVLIRMSAYLAAVADSSKHFPSYPEEETSPLTPATLLRLQAPSPATKTPVHNSFSDNTFGWLLHSSGPIGGEPPQSALPHPARTSYVNDLSEIDFSLPESSVTPGRPIVDIHPSESSGEEADKLEEPIEPLMPHWNSDFWRTYGNRLRVYGTYEGEIDLGKFEWSGIA